MDDATVPAAATVPTAWEPLEGTPEVLNSLVQNLGLDTSQWHFVDVLGLDDEMLSLTIPTLATTDNSANDIQQQVSPPTDAYSAVAMILLYPTTDRDIQAYLNGESKGNTKELPVGGHLEHPIKSQDRRQSDCIFLKQLVGGTCGTLAVVHAIANALQCYNAIVRDSPLFSIITTWNDSAKTTKRGEDILNLSRRFLGSPDVRQAHEQAVKLNDSDKRSSIKTGHAGQRQGRHFLTLVHRNGILWEVDGRRDAPTRLEMTRQDVSLKDAVARIKSIVTATQDPSIHARCSLVALVPNLVGGT